MKESTFDYEVPHKCMFPVPCDHRQDSDHDGIDDCQEPASYFVWWDTYGDGWWICEKHFKHMKDEQDKEEQNGLSTH